MTKIALDCVSGEICQGFDMSRIGFRRRGQVGSGKANVRFPYRVRLSGQKK